MVQNLKPNGLGRKTTYVSFDQLLVPTNADFGGPVLTLIELQFTFKSMQVFHRLATKRKSTQIDRSCNSDLHGTPH